MAEKFVPYDKMSKKAKSELDKKKRSDWGNINPKTKVIDTDKRRYVRKDKYPDSFTD